MSTPTASVAVMGHSPTTAAMNDRGPSPSESIAALARTRHGCPRNATATPRCFTVLAIGMVLMRSSMPDRGPRPSDLPHGPLKVAPTVCSAVISTTQVVAVGVESQPVQATPVEAPSVAVRVTEVL